VVTLNLTPMQVYEHVYEPQDDTYLLCDALTACLPSLPMPAYPLCVELGCGSGAVSAHTVIVLRDVCSTCNTRGLEALRCMYDP
jgi:methylase of polypeptide subunit release factors